MSVLVVIDSYVDMMVVIMMGSYFCLMWFSCVMMFMLVGMNRMVRCCSRLLMVFCMILSMWFLFISR